MRPGPVEYRLLGPVEARLDGRAVPLGGSRQRALLGLLLLEPGRPVAAERLIDELWRGRPPEGAATTLRSYVSRLRTALGEGATIAAQGQGYALTTDPEAVDALRFERLVREGREALAAGSPRRALEQLSAALALWRGEPFAGLADEGLLRLAAERLDGLRLLALEERIDGELALGAGAELVDELEGLVREHPYRERLWRQLMLSLYRAGRQADALAAYRRARDRLDEELGLEPTAELRALEAAILRHEIEPIVPAGGRHNLPAQVTSFVGREDELAEVAGLLATERLVTLTGAGGAGKTRLALEAAGRELTHFADGVVFVEFAGVAEGRDVPGELARALDVGDEAEAAVVDALLARLRQAETLVVLDNCEHLRAACADLAEELLRACPRVRILATSREPLGAAGEFDYPVPPLGLPPDEGDARELLASEAVTLFLERARAARPALRPDAPAVAVAARICRDLDGLPLAIELAAARAKALSLDDIAARLTDRFRFLVSWRRLSAARHRTLKEAIDWSHELLGADEQLLLARLSVFAGGFDLRAAAEVCLGGDDGRALELVSRLVDASLVIAEERDGTMRYRLLETIRQYASERLSDAGEAEGSRRLHAEWCAGLAEQAERELTGERQALWLATLEREHDNVRAALSNLQGAGDAELLLRLTIATTRFWYVRGHLTEARSRLEDALAAADGHSGTLHRRALTAAAALALLQGDYAVAARYGELSLEAARGSGNAVYIANALSNLGAIVLALGDQPRARELLEEAVALAREAGDDRIAALAINNLGDVALTAGDYERAGPLFEESRQLLLARGDAVNVARSRFNSGAVALMLGRVDEAEAHFAESLVQARQLDDREDLAWSLEGVAGVAAARGDDESAGVLLGAAGAVLESMKASFKPFERQLHEATAERARAGLGDERFRAAVRRGEAMTLDEAVSLALGRSIPA